jgi:hypothetical protein
MRRTLDPSGSGGLAENSASLYRQSSEDRHFGTIGPRSRINRVMDPQTSAAQILFTLRASEALPPSNLTTPVECGTVSPFSLDAEAYKSALEERRLWCEERAGSAFAARSYFQAGTAGTRFWFSDPDVAFEFKMRFG